MLFVVSLVAGLVLLAVAYRLSRKKVEVVPPGGLRFPSRGGDLAKYAPGAAAGGVILLVLALLQCFVVVPAGHVGVIDIFGRVPPGTLKAGINLKNPFARIITMSIKTHELKDEMEVPSKEGLTMRLEISALFHLDPEKASDVYRLIGPNYVEVLFQPQFRSVTRGVTAMYEAKALYTSEREVLAGMITNEVSKLVEPRGIVVESTPLRRLSLPASLSAAIEEKLKAEQESQRMQFVLMKEEQEAERKRIEAKGISDFQRIVSQGISENLLRWKGIEATLDIARSQNAKVVVVGAGKDGLPIILGNQ
jgi:regulator of protease activity HflC (stomatin/prohibitin superfamily)